MTKPYGFIATVVVVLRLCSSAVGQVERVWLTHRTNDPSKIIVNWTSKTAGDSTVRFGPTPQYGEKVQATGKETLHHVEIPLPKDGGKLHYSIATGDQVSADAIINGYPTNVLRVAVVADWHTKPGLKAIMADKVHLLLTAGDNISNLYKLCGPGIKDCTKPYEKLIDTYPEMFRSIPFMPVLGNHDRQIREDDKSGKPPAQAVFDIEATAFCKFFPLPDKQWNWHFDLPEFQVRFIALDLSHTEFRGTTLQSCHDFRKGSEQFEWYSKLMAKRPAGYVVTLQNERNSRMREDAGWGDLLHKNDLVISGHGFYAEREVVKGITYLNTSLGKHATPAKPANSAKSKGHFHLDEHPCYALLTLHSGSPTMTVELKDLDGKVLDSTKISMRKHE